MIFRSFSKDENKAKLYVFDEGLKAIDRCQIYKSNDLGVMVEKQKVRYRMLPFIKDPVFIMRNVNEEGDACKFLVLCKYSDEEDVTYLEQIGEVMWE